jgi:hypothetical protein
VQCITFINFSIYVIRFSATIASDYPSKVEGCCLSNYSKVHPHCSFSLCPTPCICTPCQKIHKLSSQSSQGFWILILVSVLIRISILIFRLATTSITVMCVNHSTNEVNKLGLSNKYFPHFLIHKKQTNSTKPECGFPFFPTKYLMLWFLRVYKKPYNLYFDTNSN